MEPNHSSHSRRLTAVEWECLEKSVTLSGNPDFSEGQFLVPNSIVLRIKNYGTKCSYLRPLKLVIWIGPTGTDVADAFRFAARITRAEKHPDKSVAFNWKVKRCGEINSSLEFRLYFYGIKGFYYTYSPALDCLEK